MILLCKKNKIFLAFILFFLSFGLIEAQDCLDSIEYQKAIRTADSCVAVGNFSMAYKFLNKAIVYCKEKSSLAELKKDSLFLLLDGLRERANSALAEQQKALAEIAHRNIRDAGEFVYHLDYERALTTLQQVIALNLNQDDIKKEISDSLLEIVYFFAETGMYDRAQNVLDTAVILVEKSVNASNVLDFSTVKKLINLSDTTATREAFHNAITALSPMRLKQLEERYYPVMVSIPGGTDTLGNTLWDAGDNNREKPHIVTLSSFEIARTETTWWQYNIFCKAARHQKLGIDKEGDNPAHGLSWFDAKEYANWISKQKGLSGLYSGSDYDITCAWKTLGYRLPTEAEWEYAARAGTNSRFGNGKDTIDPKEINFYAAKSYTESYAIAGVNRDRTVPVGSLNSPNAFGLYDMSGNVWEWCWDGWDLDNYSTLPTSDPHGSDSGIYRILRGGSWLYGPNSCRVAFRNFEPPNSEGYGVGCRLVRTE